MAERRASLPGIASIVAGKNSLLAGPYCVSGRTQPAAANSESDDVELENRRIPNARVEPLHKSWCRWFASPSALELDAYSGIENMNCFSCF